MPKRIKLADVTMTRVHPSGAWEASAIIDDQLVCRTYYGYTKRDACHLFVDEINSTTK